MLKLSNATHLLVFAEDTDRESASIFGGAYISC